MDISLHFRYIGIGLSILFLCACGDEPKEAQAEEEAPTLMAEGVVDKRVTEFADREPVKTYVMLRRKLAENDLKGAAKHSTDFELFMEKQEFTRQRVGEQRFRNNYSKSLDSVVLHAVYYEGNQAVLVLDTGQRMGAAFMIEEEGSWREIQLGGEKAVSQVLHKKFYDAREQDEAESSK